ncbi:MAG: diacylglycerol/polyprenol kinase family protein [Candidatus Hydrothermarchaeales archaeon]
MEQLELRRQLIHASGIFVALLIRQVYVLFGGWRVPALILFLAICAGYGVSYLHRSGANLLILTKIINDAERERDKGFPGRGALRFLTGALLALLVFRHSPDIVAAGIIVLALGDSASTLGGIAFGRHKILYNKEKSLEGSLTGLLAAIFGLMLLTPFSLAAVATASLAGVIVESLPLGVDDNLTVPLAAGIAIRMLAEG